MKQKFNHFLTRDPKVVTEHRRKGKGRKSQEQPRRTVWGRIRSSLCWFATYRSDTTAKTSTLPQCFISVVQPIAIYTVLVTKY